MLIDLADIVWSRPLLNIFSGYEPSHQLTPFLVKLMRGLAALSAVAMTYFMLAAGTAGVPAVAVGHRSHQNNFGECQMSYVRFGALIATSTVVMFGLMYLNTYAIDHVFFSQTRAWMALLMGAVMAVIMLLFMWRMYENKAANVATLGLAVIVFSGSLWLVRSQQTVSDLDYMRAMIPHHSIAVLTSTRAHIRDPRVRELADDIIEAQIL